jgi:hypothetical protein
MRQVRALPAQRGCSRWWRCSSAGNDDREAAHPLASVTVYRFLPGAVDEEEFMFMADLHARMVVTGQVEYAERRRRGREMVGSVVETYTLIILGRSSGGRSHDARHAHADAEARVGSFKGIRMPARGPHRRDWGGLSPSTYDSVNYCNTNA